MKIGEKLLKKLTKKYGPEQMVHQKFERYDISFKTDEEGNPVLLFIGTRREDGQIKGERFGRVLIRDKDGKILKDHWDNKGKS
ncbi:hypothetical protein [Dyadobacter psychrophilus]|uniref:Uncharacterized protein n=1 Tax=Dyadobacter psychrophilus TaxID=651661 RepID=A0A1T5EQD7_9BACT|nr:hypothetical protein [Dyadobacter psychrophilus]SKB86157.1 hypothetical protein SAMN05660293_02684 [Dyadobacter psychrophilus]